MRRSFEQFPVLRAGLSGPACEVGLRPSSKTDDKKWLTTTCRAKRNKERRSCHSEMRGSKHSTTWLGKVHPPYKQQVLNDSALSFLSYAVGAMKTWVHVPHSHPGWSSVSIEDQELALLMQIIKENINDMGCTWTWAHDRSKAKQDKMETFSSTQPMLSMKAGNRASSSKKKRKPAAGS